MKRKILVTGATGNVGSAVIKYLDREVFEPVLAVRDINKVRDNPLFRGCSFHEFNFETVVGFDNLADIDTVFLNRPPHIGDVKRYIFPFIDKIKDQGVQKVIFLSVQGAEKKGFLPHSKIEKYLSASGLSSIILRPSYFMENITTTLWDELTRNHRIFMPSGSLQLNWIDVGDIGKAAARVIKEFPTYANRAFFITSPQNYTFRDIIEKINTICKCNFTYESPNVLKYIIYMKRHGQPLSFIAIMLLLHFLPRFEKPPEISDDYYKLMSETPLTIDQFIKNHCDTFTKI